MPRDGETYFLPAARLENEEINAISREISASPAAVSLELMPLAVIITNETRQIVYANERFLAIIGAKSFADVAGKRPGEALGCSHAWETLGGCGTSRFCRYCGAANAIVKSMGGEKDTQECCILRTETETQDTLNLQIWTSPFEVNSHELVLSSILDIAHEKALRGFERIFFHDILNAVTGIKGLHDIFSLELGNQYPSELHLLHNAIESLQDVIESHRDFLAVEAHSYVRSDSAIESRTLLESLASYGQAFAHNRKFLEVDADSPSLFVNSDVRLVQRILVNMLKNALEASVPGDTITLGCSPAMSGGVAFWVRNPAVMSEETRMHIFEKGFSTKGVGRGLGTYGMRLFAETCLNARVHFESCAETGTIFYLELPK